MTEEKRKYAVLGEMVEHSLEWDDLAYVVPMAIPEELDALALDIQENGLREPVMMWRGKVVDGRCRDLACTRVGERIRVKELDDELTEEDVERLVKSVNTRRNLSKTQKTMVAARNYLDTKGRGIKISIAKAAQEWGVSDRYVKHGIKLWEACPDWAQKLFDGEAIDLGNDGKIYNVYQAVKLCKPLGSKDDDRDNGARIIDIIKTQNGVKEYEKVIREFKNISTKSEQEHYIKTKIAELMNYKWRD